MMISNDISLQVKSEGFVCISDLILVFSKYFICNCSLLICSYYNYIKVKFIHIIIVLICFLNLEIFILKETKWSCQKENCVYRIHNRKLFQNKMYSLLCCNILTTYSQIYLTIYSHDFSSCVVNMPSFLNKKRL